MLNVLICIAFDDSLLFLLDFFWLGALGRILINHHCPILGNVVLLGNFLLWCRLVYLYNAILFFFELLGLTLLLLLLKQLLPGKFSPLFFVSLDLLVNLSLRDSLICVSINNA